MSSRGSYAIYKRYTNYEYKTIAILDNGEEVLEGTENNHSIPDYSFSPNSIYIIKKNGVFHAMRIYNEKHEPILEIAYHPEPILNHKNRKDSMWHMHKYGPNLERGPAELISDEVKNKYRKLLKDIGYDKW